MQKTVLLGTAELGTKVRLASDKISFSRNQSHYILSHSVNYLYHCNESFHIWAGTEL